ncbi:MAG: hypothetical protein R3C62_00700 [Chloroflexota bacterium]
MLAVLFMLSLATAITFGATVSGEPLQRNLPLQTSLGSMEIRDAYTFQQVAAKTIFTDSKLVATHSIGGATWAVTGDGNRLYYNVGADLVIANSNNPATPSTLAHWSDSNKAQFYNIHAANNLLYVPHGFSGVDIIDASNVNQPAKVGNIPIRYLGPTTAIHDIETSGNYAFVPQGKWFRVVDITNPTIPTDVAVITATTSWLRSVTVSDSYAYLTSGSDGLIVVDISSPNSPSVVGSIATQNYAQGLVKQGNYVYLALTNAILVIDVSNPNAPVQIGVYQPPNFSPRENMIISGKFLYLRELAELHIVDISNPGAPTQVSVLSLPSLGDGLYLSGSTVYLGTEEDGLVIVDASNPGLPSLIKTIAGEMIYTGSAARANGNVFATSQQELWYLGLHQPSYGAATLIWSTPLRLGEMAARGEFVYLTKSDGLGGSGYLEILNAKNPYSPASLGTTTLSIQGASSIALSDSYAYIGSWSGISAINIENPSSPYETSSVSVASGVNVQGVDVEGGYLYAATTAGLKIYDISNPATLNFVGEYGVWTDRVVVSGRYAYLIANDTQPFHIVDVLTPSTPTLVRTLNTCGASSSIALSNGYAYVTDGCRSIALYDVNNPLSGSSYPVASTGLPSFGQQVVVEGDDVSVATGSGGFVQLKRFDRISDDIPTSGGSLTSPDANVTINIPANTYANTVRVRYEEEPVMNTGSLRSGGFFFTVSSYDVSTGELAPLPVGKSISITLDYLPSSVREDTLQLYKYQSSSSIWEPIPGTVNSGSQQVTAQLTSFSGNDTFALLGESYQAHLPLVLR